MMFAQGYIWMCTVVLRTFIPAETIDSQPAVSASFLPTPLGRLVGAIRNHLFSLLGNVASRLPGL